MPNKRIFYACQAVAVNGSFVNGAQTVAVTTNFDIEPILQLGQIDLVDMLTLNPTVDVSLSRILSDSNTPLWTGNFLTNVRKDDSTITLSIGDDTSEDLTTSIADIHITGAGITSISYNFSVDGAFTEEVGFSARGKDLTGGSVTAIKDTTSKPKTRQFLDMGASSIPSLVTDAGNLTSVNINSSIGRENILELGKYNASGSFANLPAEVSVDFEVTADTLDTIEIPTVTACSSPTGDAFEAQDIEINVCGYTFTMENCKLSNVSYSGGDTGGGNATITFSYITFNSLTRA